MNTKTLLQKTTIRYYMAQQISHIPDANKKQFLVYNATTHGNQDTKKIFCKIQKAAKSKNCTVPGIITCLDYAGSRENRISFYHPHHHWVFIFPVEKNTNDLITAVGKIIKWHKGTYFEPHPNNQKVETLVSYNCKAARQTLNNSFPIDPLIYPFNLISTKSHRHRKCLNRASHYFLMITTGRIL